MKLSADLKLITEVNFTNCFYITEEGKRAAIEYWRYYKKPGPILRTDMDVYMEYHYGIN